MRKRGRLAVSMADSEGNALKIQQHLEHGGSLRTCPVSSHFRDIVREVKPDFWQKALKISAENSRLAKARAATKRMLARTVCANGHQLTPETSKIIIKRQHTQKHGTWQSRICLICEREKHRTASFSADDVAALVEGAKAGLTLSQLTSYRNGATRVLRQNQASTILRAKPKLAGVLLPLFARNRATNHRVLMQRLSPRGIFAPTNDVVLREVEAAVPLTLPRQTRMDVVGDMVVAVLEGRLDLRDLKSRYREFVARVDDTYQDRYFTSKTPVSLDAEPLREGETPLIEKLSRARWEEMVADERA
ncbi:hypothetical protein [Bradyrhizobium sp. NBAIM08]|uniref:hypothetical protein n=1 Tax=Bradyrhizobium sp. NBAIM08 TaxID=2793815 RepID=UPI001CD3992C|nr:hypothetical protein [Bradyrhizobium sp. NBAIM08]MCA1474777.1 hypothetical protein [Bradyrhizobium sp. NBAIM08]